MNLNLLSQTLCDKAVSQSATLRITASHLAGGRVLDFGIDAAGGLAAGCVLARVCLGGLAEVTVVPEQESVFGSAAAVSVATDHPSLACLGGQYAGWPVQVGDFFAMGSGPMRMARGREEVLESLGLRDVGLKDSEKTAVVGVLESDKLPTAEVIRDVAEQCGVACEAVTLAVAPVTSIAGVVQVVARSVETAMHKLHALGLDPRMVQSAFGVAPLPPPATETVGGIGRTNDAILYGGRVTLWVDADQAVIDQRGPQVPSGASSDHGRPFAEIFKSYGYDFYKVDPQLFSPAVVTFVNLRTGISRTFGEVDSKVLRRSFTPSNVGEVAGRDAEEFAGERGGETAK